MPEAVPSPAPKKRKIEPDYDMAEKFNRDIANKYVKGKDIGEGTYATVYRGHLVSDPSHIVAIKKFKIDADIHRKMGVGPDTIREIKYLQELSHNNIVKLYDVYATKDQNIHMVIEFLGRGSLEDLIKDLDIGYGLSDIKAWMGMIWRAIFFCHSNFVLHRDLKPGNLLVGYDGEVKVADFGLARSFATPEQVMTSEVITLWYRPPELLFGARHYSGQVDVWSIGTIMAELLIRKPFIAYMPATEAEFSKGGAQTHIGQLDAINFNIGTPREDVWPGVSKLKDYFEPEPYYPLRTKQHFRGVISTIDETGLDLLMWTLTLDPRNRPDAKQCLEHEWWQSDPRPTDKKDLPYKRDTKPENVAKSLAQKPGVVDERFKDVARKLDFGASK